MHFYQTIVIGLGGIGSATLYHLARRGGGKVLGIDQYPLPHAHGSTHGGTRITRLANGEGDEVTQLALRARTLWREAEEALGVSLLTECGGLIVEGAEGGDFNHFGSYFDRTVEQAVRHGIAHEMLNTASLRDRFPQFKVEEGERGYYEPTAGFLSPEGSVTGHLKLAREAGATVRTEVAVKAIRETADGVSLITSDGELLAGQVVVTAGPWIGSLLPEIGDRFSTIRQITFWFDPEGEIDPWLPGRFPVFIWAGRNGKRGMYGFPAVDGPEGGIKMAGEFFSRPAPLDRFRRDVSLDEIETMHRDYVAPLLPGVSNRCIRAATCVFTDTQDYRFILDRHPEMRRVVIASPCSGYGFKYTPALGEAIAAMTAGCAPRVDLSAYSLKRFS